MTETQSWLSWGETGFLALDNWKQKGFYVNQTGSKFVAPRHAVEPSLAKAVVNLAWRATTTLDFLLKGGNLEKHIDNARSIRAKLTEQEHHELERLGKKQFQKIFEIPDEDI
jgi:hypothetical protein